MTGEREESTEVIGKEEQGATAFFFFFAISDQILELLHLSG